MIRLHNHHGRPIRGSSQDLFCMNAMACITVEDPGMSELPNPGPNLDVGPTPKLKYRETSDSRVIYRKATIDA
jgi:hypothetical protein